MALAQKSETTKTENTVFIKNRDAKTVAIVVSHEEELSKVPECHHDKDIDGVVNGKKEKN